LPEIGSPTQSANEVADMQKQMSADMDAMLNASEVQLALKAEQEAKVKEMFAKYDKDNSGTLETSELCDIFKELGLAMTDDQFKYYASAMLKDFDNDKSNSVDFKEFKKFYARCLKTEEIRSSYSESITKKAREEKLVAHARKMFKKYDKDGSKTLDSAEMDALLKETLGEHITFTDAEWEAISRDVLKRGDKDKSGAFEFNEFLNMYKKCLATPNLKKKYEQKIVMRHQNGEWKVDDGM